MAFLSTRQCINVIICRDTSHGLVVNKKHKFYYQVQQLMLWTKSCWIDLVISDTVNLIILHVKKNKKFLAEKLPKLKSLMTTTFLWK